MCCIKKKNFLSLVKQTQNYVHFATLRTKKPFIFLQIASKLVSYGLTSNSFSMEILRVEKKFFNGNFIDSKEFGWFLRCQDMFKIYLS